MPGSQPSGSLAKPTNSACDANLSRMVEARAREATATTAYPLTPAGFAPVAGLLACFGGSATILQVLYSGKYRPRLSMTCFT